MRLLVVCAVLLAVLAPSAQAELLVGLTTSNRLVTFSALAPNTNVLGSLFAYGPGFTGGVLMGGGP